LLAAIKADHVGLLLQGEWTGQMLMTATKDDFVKKIENSTKDFHELGPSSFSSQSYDLEG
jgi:hypothetical protein